MNLSQPWFVSVKKVRRPDARIAFALPPRIGKNINVKLKRIYLFSTTYNWKSLTFCARTCVKQSAVPNLKIQNN